MIKLTHWAWAACVAASKRKKKTLTVKELKTFYWQPDEGCWSANTVQRRKGFVGHTCIFFKCDELSQSTAFTFKNLLIFLEYVFQFLINTAPPVSDRKENFRRKALNIIIFPPFFFIIFFFFFFLPIGWFQFVPKTAFTPSRGVAINVFLV